MSADKIKNCVVADWLLSLHESVQSDVAWLRANPLIKKETAVKGCIYDIVSGKLDVVEA